MTSALYFPKEFKTKWIRIIPGQVHDGKMWLDELVKITKDVIHMVTGYPLCDKEKSLRHPPKNDIEKLTGVEWDNKGMKINTISDPKTRFRAYVISYKIFQSSKLNSITGSTIDIAYKTMKKGLQLDLAEIMLSQLEENMRTI